MSIKESPLSKVLTKYRDTWHDKAEDVLSELAVAELVRQGIISSGMGSKMLEMDRWQFADILAKYNVPSIDTTVDEVREEAAELRKLRDTTG